MLHKNIRGRSLHAPSNEIVENQTGADLTPLKVVAFDGMGINFPKVRVANPLVYTTFGVVQNNIKNGKPGYITCLGLLFDVDTSAWSEGTVLYSTASGDLSPVALGSAVALVIKSDLEEGTLYVFGIASFIDTPDGQPWDITGNTGITPANYLGTNDAADLVIKTDATFRSVITSQGRFGYGELVPDEYIHVKAHSLYPGTGHRQTTYAVTTNDTNWNLAYSYVLPTSCVAQVNVTTVGYTPAPAFIRRCSFQKTATVFREDSDATLVAQAQSDYTFRDSDFDVRIRVSNDTVLVEVRAATADATKWTGYVNIDVTK